MEKKNLQPLLVLWTEKRNQKDWLIDSEKAKKMEEKGKRVMGLLVLLMFATFQGCFSEASQPTSKKKSTQSTAAHRFGSTAVFPITGNVYPLGYVYFHCNCSFRLISYCLFLLSLYNLWLFLLFELACGQHIACV